MRSGKSDLRVPMEEDEFNRIKAAFERKGNIMVQSTDADRHLDNLDANASTIGSDIILFRSGSPPTRSEIFEELIHTSQNRTGRATGTNWVEMEIEAKQRLIRNQRVYRIPDLENADTLKHLNELIAFKQKGE